MSMLTSQCRQLHDMANDLREHYTFVGFGGMANRDPTIFSAARQMDDAADTIEGLREELLYVQTHWELDHCPNCEARLDLMVLRDENAKLRELVSVVYGYYASGTINPCDICDSIGCQYVGEAESGCRYHDHFDSAEAADDEIQRRMRELGIEVE